MTRYILTIPLLPLAIAPLYAATSWADRAIVSLVTVASILMHISETKHGLNGGIFARYSNLFLNIDRAMAIIATPYFLPRASLHDFISIGIGTVAMAIGEYRTSSPFHNNIVYPLTHTFWHICVYYAMYAQLVKLKRIS